MKRLMPLIIIVLFFSSCSNNAMLDEPSIEQAIDISQPTPIQTVPVIPDENHTENQYAVTEDDNEEIRDDDADITFADFNISELFFPYRQFQHIDQDITYNYYEFTTKATIEEIENWIRSENKRLGGELNERYSYINELEGNQDFILNLPSLKGSRVVSTYLQQYLGIKYLIILETEFPNIDDMVDIDYEDHALVISIPHEDLTITEVYKGMYFHQHTDIYVRYFYSRAFFEEVAKHSKILKDREVTDNDYKVGYFDKNGVETSPYDISGEKFNDYIFGIQLQTDFLPKDTDQQEQFLIAWAKTLLLGDRAYSRIYDETETIYFLKGSQVFKSYTLEQLVNN